MSEEQRRTSEQPIDPREPALSGSARGLVDQIFLGSAAMIGVAVTLMGLIGVIKQLRTDETSIDDLLAADAVLFLVATLASYFALRTSSARNAHRYRTVADPAFILGMIVTVVIGVMIARDLI